MMDVKKIGDLFRTFLIVGAFTIGGGWAMAPLIKREVVDRRKWLTDDQFLDGLAVVQASPGPIAVNLAVFIGHRLAGPAGVAAATLGAILPSFLVILLISLLFVQVEFSAWLGRFFAGARPAVLALIIGAVWDLGSAALKDRQSVIFAAVALLLIAVFRLHPIAVILGGIAIGLMLFKLRRR